MDPTYPLFPILSFLSFIIVLIPLPWHLQAWNSGTCAFMIWTAVQCFVQFVNAVVWYGNVENPAPIWCDISTQLLLGAGIGIPASILCISRRLYTITSVQTANISQGDKRRAVLIDIGIALGIPIMVLIMHIPVHPHRFNILEDVGCYPVTYVTIPAFFLFYMWAPLLGVISFIYSALTLRSFFIRRAQFASILSTATTMTINRYLRLMLLSLADMCFTVPLGIYIIYISTAGITIAPWISWEDTHFNFGRIVYIPAALWRSDMAFNVTVELSRWLGPFCALMFFALFGFASEAQKNYRIAFWWCTKLFGFKPQPKGPKFTLPSWNSKATPNSKPVLIGTIGSPSPVAPRKGSSFSSPDFSISYMPDGIEYDIPLSPTTYKVMQEWEKDQLDARMARLSDHEQSTIAASNWSTKSTISPIAVPDQRFSITIGDAQYVEQPASRPSFSSPSPYEHDRPISQFSDDFAPPLATFPQPPPYGVSRPYSTSTIGLKPRTELKHAVSAPEMPIPTYQGSSYAV